MYRLIGLSVLVSGIAAQDVATKAELTRRIATRHAAMNSVRVEFTYPEGGVTGHYVFAELAMLGGSFLRLDSGHGWTGMDWTKFYSRTRSFVVGRRYDVLWPNKLAFESRQLKDAESLERFEVQGWIRATGFWPQNCMLPDPEFYGVNLNLLAVVQDDRYAVADHLTEHKGTPCLILEWPGHDRIALDPARGYALLARSWFQDGELAMTVEVSRLAQHGSDVYLPAAYRIRTLRDWDGSLLTPPADLDTSVRVTELGTVKEGDFKMERPPGVWRFDRRHPERMKQTTAGGLEFLVRSGDRFAAVYTAEGGGTGWSWIWVAVVAVVSFCFAWWLPGFAARRAASRVIRPRRETRGVLIGNPKESF